MFSEINEFTYLRDAEKGYFDVRLLVCSGARMLFCLVAFSFLTISDASKASWPVASRLAFAKTTF